jgi:hypothetical protein
MELDCLQGGVRFKCAHVGSARRAARAYSSAGSTEAPPFGGASENWNEEVFLKPSRIFEALTLPSVFPALGHGVGKDYRAHSKDLLAQKVCLFAPHIVLQSMYGLP